MMAIAASEIIVKAANDKEIVTSAAASTEVSTEVSAATVIDSKALNTPTDRHRRD